MAKAARRLFAGGKRFDASKHPRAAGGRFANKPGAGDDAPQGGKSSDVVDTDVITVVAPGNMRRGPAAARFGLYKNGMTVRDYMNAVTAAGEDPKTALKAIAWDHNKGWIRLDAADATSIGAGNPGYAPNRRFGPTPAQGQSYAQLAAGQSIPPQVTPPAPGAAPSQPITGRALTDAEALADPQRAQWVAAANLAHRANQTAGHPKPGDVGLAEFMRQQGKDHSDVLDRAAFDAYDGEILLRGVAGSSMVKAQYDASEHFMGNGVFGNGQYYGWRDNITTPWGYAQSIPPGHVFVSKLSSRAVVADYETVRMEHAQFTRTAAFQGMDPGAWAFLGDVGRYAAWRGYDAIDVNGKGPPGARWQGARGKGNEDYVVGLNKRAFVVSRESLPGEAYDQQASVPQPPDTRLLAAKTAAVQTYQQQVAALATAAQAGTVATPAQVRNLSNTVIQILQYDSSIAASATASKADAIKRIFAREYGITT